MQVKKATAAVAGIAALGFAGTTVASGAGAPSTVKITQAGGVEFKANQYIKDKLRWKKNVYSVKSGGTVKVINTVNDEGPHTFTVVKKSDLPKSFNCKPCDAAGKALGVDPENEEAPPKFQYAEDGVGQETAPNVDKPGDTGLTGSGKKNESITMKVTAKSGTTLYFICAIHPWMQSKLLVK